tara:strand:+ start:585 stop:845 length:261 start_codon:yes stop_codon:yes gene_type:complete
MAERGRPKKSDPVNSPSHYKSDNGIECIDAMVAAFGREAVNTYCEIASFKYHWRAGKKDGNTKDQDLAKATWYTSFARGKDPRVHE